MRKTLALAFAFGLLGITNGSTAIAAPTAARSEASAAVTPLKRARARFIAHLDSPKHLDKLDGVGKQQLYLDLSARFPGHETLAKLAPDAALLLEMKRLSTNTAEVELASRYGSKLMLAHQHDGSRSMREPVRFHILRLYRVRPDGKQEDASDRDLEVFGVTKPKHFKQLLEKAMTNIAPEDYE